MTRNVLAQHISENLEPQLNQSYYLLGVACAIEPLCKQALQDSTITAWVGGDDDEAVCALSFLKRNRVAVPGKISCVGFNNSLTSLRNNLTSHSWNYDAIFSAMVNHIIRPDWPGAQQQHAPAAMGGYVVERGSTSAAPV